jgi:uncharacterized membrane protein
MMSYFGGFAWMSLLSWSTMLLFWAGVILLAVWIVRSFRARDHRSDADIARDVLQQRFTAGEISEGEYQQAMKTLGSK